MTSEVKKKGPGGRPSSYRPDIGDIICERLVEGESLRSICRDPDMPVVSTVFRWIRMNPEFSKQYADAREHQADTLADEILEIADNSTNDWMEKHGKDDAGWQLNGDHYQRTRLRVDTRKWIASKMKPKKYSDRMELTGEGGGPVAFVLRDLTKSSDG